MPGIVVGTGDTMVSKSDVISFHHKNNMLAFADLFAFDL